MECQALLSLHHMIRGFHIPQRTVYIRFAAISFLFHRRAAKSAEFSWRCSYRKKSIFVDFLNYFLQLGNCFLIGITPAIKWAQHLPLS